MRRVLTFLTIAGALAAAPSPASAQQVEPVAGMVGAADAIVPGPDGALWASQTDDPGRIARITTGGEVTYAAVGGIGGFPVDRGPAGITRHADALWFTLTSTPETFARLVPGGATSAFSLSYGRPTALASGPDGALWMTVDGGNAADAIARYSPAESYFPLGIDVDPRAIVAGPDGALWFVEDGRIGRVTTGGTLSYRSVGVTPTALAAGADGTLWYAQGATVRRLDDPTVYATGSPVSALATGADGALWAAVRGGLARIVPGEAPALITQGIDPAAQGTALAATPDRRLWLTLDRAPYLLRVTLPAPPTGTPTPTPAPPAPTPAPPTPTPTAAPAGAVEGTSVEVRVLSGTVSYRVPPETDYTRISGRMTLPLGVLLDSEAGKLRLTSQVDGAPQSGDFNGGKFSVTQTATGMTELALAGPLSCTRADRAKAATSQKKQKAKKKKRSIWGKDSGGSFRTRGNGSVATVRGTEWRTEDTCAGTTVYVRKGAVSVWPRRGGKSKLVRAGQRFFAPRPR